MKDPFKRIGRKFVAGGVTVLLGFLVVAALLPPEDEDPSRFGPARYLRIQACRVQPTSTGHELVVRGVTNLVAKARLRVDVQVSGRTVQSYETSVDAEAFTITESSKGALEPGTYQVRVSFRLEDQPRVVGEALHFQPRRLETVGELKVEAEAGAGPSLRAEFRALFEEVNQLPADASTLTRLDERARELSERIFIAKEKSALHKLRLAIEVAGRPRFDRREFERLLLEAHVLAGL